MDDKDKIYYAETIDENPFPSQEGDVDFGVSQNTGSDEFSQVKTEPQPFPTRRVAYEVIGNALNTRSKKILGEFEFTQQGAIQIGKYENGLSGDIKISPAGLVARNSSGTVTIAIDGETGDAVFRGTIRAGTIISGLVVVGDNNVIIDGDARRIVINDGTHDRVLIGYQLDGF